MNQTGFTCYWRIENFGFLEKNSGVVLFSPMFSENMFEEYFFLKILEYEHEFLAIHLSKTSKAFRRRDSSIKSISYSISLLTKTGWIAIIENIRHTLSNDENSDLQKIVSWEKLQQEKWLYLPGGCLTVKFDLWNERKNKRNKSAQCLIISRMLNKKEINHLPLETFYELKPSDMLNFPASYEFKNNSKETKETQTDISGEDHVLNNQEDILKHFQETKLCFVTLKTFEKEFMVHKAVLCASSPVFKAMFENDMYETAKNVVNIDDIDDDAMTFLIHFLHLEHPEDLNWDKTLKLYYAADKYQIEVLKKWCRSRIKKDLSDQHICELFILADTHQDGDLKQFALDYFIKNSTTILRSMEWKNFLSDNTELAAEVLHKSADDLFERQKPEDIEEDDSMQRRRNNGFRGRGRPRGGGYCRTYSREGFRSRNISPVGVLSREDQDCERGAEESFSHKTKVTNKISNSRNVSSSNIQQSTVKPIDNQRENNEEHFINRKLTEKQTYGRRR